MDAEIVQISAVEKTVTPTLAIVVKIKSSDGPLALLGVSGHLCSGPGKLLAPIFEMDESSRTGSVTLQASGRDRFGGRSREDEAYVWLGAQLGPRELDHIEDARAKDPKTDVHLRLHLTIRFLVPTALLSTVPEGTWAKMFGLVPTPPGTVPNGRTLSILHEVPGSGFLVVKKEGLDPSKRIPGTDWVKDLAPGLGLGTFAVLEIPEAQTFNNITDDRIKAAVVHTRKAGDLLRSGEWEAVCEELRHVWEALRDLPLVQDALVKDGYSPAAAGFVNGALKELFNLASKFVHSLDKDKTVLPEIRPQKEDAYLVYTTTMAALNLITRKAQRGQRQH